MEMPLTEILPVPVPSRQLTAKNAIYASIISPDSFLCGCGVVVEGE